MNKFYGFLGKIASVFQPAYDKIKAIKPDPKIQEAADKIMDMLPDFISDAIMAEIYKCYKKYGKEMAEKLIRDIAEKLVKEILKKLLDVNS